MKIMNIYARKITLKSLVGVLPGVVLLVISFSVSAVDNVGHGEQASLRGLTQLDATRPADEFKQVPKDHDPFVSSYVYQPPLIPHQIRNYELSLNANKCLSCHSFKNAREAGATRISVTHYATREGTALSDVSPRRYFCLQCHVVQTEAEALIENTYQKVESLQ